jgi:predicted nuclease of predicted toxin-antitoxin system
MAEIRFRFDEHMPNAIARELRRRGIDVETTRDAGLISASDQAHLTHARSQGRVMVTEDEEYLRLHFRGQEHSGIAYFVQGPRPIGEIIEWLELLHDAFEAEEMVGRLEWL